MTFAKNVTFLKFKRFNVYVFTIYHNVLYKICYTFINNENNKKRNGFNKFTKHFR